MHQFFIQDGYQIFSHIMLRNITSMKRINNSSKEQYIKEVKLLQMR